MMKRFNKASIPGISLLLFLALILMQETQATKLSELAADFGEIVCNILCVIFYIIAAIAALIIIISGIRYMTSENPHEKDDAKKRMVYATLGLIIVLIAPLAANYITESLGILPFECGCFL